EGAGLDLVTQDLGQQVGGVDQSFLGALTHAGADFVHHRAQHEPAGQTDEKEVDKEDAYAQRHGKSLSRFLARSYSRARDGSGSVLHSGRWRAIWRAGS